MPRLIIALLTLSLLISGCKFRDFLPYYLKVDKETQLPDFSDWTHFMGENHSLRSCYDISCYDWRVHVDQQAKKLEGSMRILFTATSSSDSLLLDMGSALKVVSIEGSLDIRKIRRKRNALFVLLETPLQPGTKEELVIHYKGKPVNIRDQGPVMWEEDQQGNPFVGTITQGIGPQHMMPCKDLLQDEPDSVFIRVSSASNQVVAANGKLLEVEKQADVDIYHFRVHNPLNIYNLSFNIGSYVSEHIPYKDINGQDRNIEIVALDYSVEQALAHYQQTVPILQSLEKRWGPFPWWEDGCKIVQSTFYAMEHQSAISMGPSFFNNYRVRGTRPDSAFIPASAASSEDIDLTLVHELSHEWWGNLLTAHDYADAWLHEGFATYNEALYIEDVRGREEFIKYMNILQRGIENERPVRKVAGVRYNSWAHSADGDIYNKGGLILHTLRQQIDNDSLFFGTLRKALHLYNRKTWTSEDFIALFSEATGQDLQPLISWYLDQSLPPVLLVRYQNESGTREYKWREAMPEGFSFRIKAMVGANPLDLFPTNEWQKLTLPKGDSLSLAPLESGYFWIE